MTNYLTTCFFLISVLIVLITSQENQTSSSGKSLLPNNCGTRRYNDANTFGGKDAIIGAWPWIVLIYGEETFEGPQIIHPLCGGSLINDRYVVTAAHCIVFGDLKYASIGEHTLGVRPDCGKIRGRQICAPPEQNIEIESSISHPKYDNPCLLCNDIGLIRLARKVHIDNEFVTPICLPFNLKEDINSSFHELNGYDGKVAGWGGANTGIPSESSDVLQESFLRIQELSYCQNQTQRVGDPNMILCAGGFYSNDTCSGEHGGSPLTLINSNITSFLIGIFSYGHSRCVHVGGQLIYTNVNHYVEWIVNNLKP